MRWFLVALILFLNSSLLIVFINELISNFREKPLMIKDDFIIKHSISICSITNFFPLWFFSWLLSVIIIALDGSEPWYAYLIILFFILIFIVIFFAILDLIHWRVVIKDGKIKHYSLSKTPYQSFEVEDVIHVNLHKNGKRWTIIFYQDEKRPIGVSEYYSRHIFSKRRKGFDLLFDLLEEKMLSRSVSEYRRQKESEK